MRAVEWLGHECLITADLDDRLVTLRQAGMAILEPGAEVKVRVDDTDVHLFDADTTERLT